MASSSEPKRSYPVFLSFRGEDVRKNILGHLDTALVQQGICPYKDDRELGKGGRIWTELMKAIKDSRMAIIFFSEDYAFSKWCLDEAAEIMDCKEKRGLMVFPVFYKVEPREVRTPRQKYREALDMHESNLRENSERVKGWKKALFNAGSLSGWHFKDGDDESELIQKIVKEIVAHLYQEPLHVAKHPVGIDSQVEWLKSLLSLESDDGVVMAGLWGQGGIGKTTLAKAVYNDIFRQFEASCFLANVRETSKESCTGLVTLQTKLLSELLRNRELVVSSVHAGTNLMQERLWNKKILLVLDDVDDLRQLNALAGEGEWFGKGSRIIITTRDKHLLTVHGIDHFRVYEVEALDESEAHELFTKHAFPTHGRKLIIRNDLVGAVLNYAKGLPLALEVLGSFLCGRSENAWKSTLNKLSKIPDSSINDALKISYDGLEENEKEIFLHVACFFKGRETRYVKKVLDSCDLETEIGLEILIERCLISGEGCSTLQMHDLIQYMGMDIVNQDCRDDPMRRSRVWLYDDLLDVLSYDMGDSVAKAIILEPPELKEICIGSDAFTKMRRLKLLILRNVQNSFQGPVYLPNQLRWFEWPGAPFPVFPSGPKKLVGLDMSTSSIMKMPKSFKELQQLKYIKMKCCETLASMPDLSCTPNLKELVLIDCKNLVEAHESIAYHDNLQVLDLEGCSELTNFPDVLKSKSLRTLNLNGCTKFERFPDIPHKLEGLEELSLEGTAIKGLPTSIENLIFLKEMRLNKIKSLVSLPSTIYMLHNLHLLELQGCTNLMGLPKYDNSGDPCVEYEREAFFRLGLRGCNLCEAQFLENPSCFPFLSDLDLTGNNIISLPASLNKRAHLSSMAIGDCHQLQEIPELPPNLRLLYAQGCESLNKNRCVTSLHQFVRIGLTMAEWPDHFVFNSSGVEMPEWVFPIEEGSAISFMASKDLYDKFLALALCIVYCDSDEPDKEDGLVVSHVNGKTVNHCLFTTFAEDVGYIWVEYLAPQTVWGEVDFSEIGGGCVPFSSTLSSFTRVKKWGIRILCKPLGENLKAVLQDHKLMDLGLLYEVRHESVDP